MIEHAAEERQEPEDDLDQHQGTEAERSSTEASSGDSSEQGGQIQAPPPRPPMMTPWYSDIDQN